MERKDEYLRNAINNLLASENVSNLQCNVRKIMVIPVGHFDKEEKFTPSVNLECQEYFSLLGLYIDNKLKI